MYNRKRQVREITNQVMIYDTQLQHLVFAKVKGISVQPRKDHSAAIYGKSNSIYLYNNFIFIIPVICSIL